MTTPLFMVFERYVAINNRIVPHGVARGFILAADHDQVVAKLESELRWACEQLQAELTRTMADVIDAESSDEHVALLVRRDGAYQKAGKILQEVVSGESAEEERQP